jgi:uncharacterized membrane protein YcgQ (UPF0703/DUF1980 family)
MYYCLLITCCAADNYPVSLPVKLDAIGQNRNNYHADRWFEIVRTMIIRIINGRRQLTIQPVTINAIATPKNPYDFW